MTADSMPESGRPRAPGAGEEESRGKVEKILQDKITKIIIWRYQVILFDDHGKRLFTDYYHSDIDPDTLMDHVRKMYESKNPGKRPAMAIIIERRIVTHKIF